MKSIFSPGTMLEASLAFGSIQRFKNGSTAFKINLYGRKNKKTLCEYEVIFKSLIDKQNRTFLLFLLRILGL